MLDAPDRTSIFLIANLGAEIVRMFNAKDRGDKDNLSRSYKRAKDILSSVVQYEDMKDRINELEKLNDAISSIVRPNGLFVSKKSLNNFFEHFALRVMS